MFANRKPLDVQGDAYDAGYQDAIEALRADRDAVLAILADWTRPSAIRLMAGEMTAQEMRTARAVANGLAAKIRRILDPSN